MGRVIAAPQERFAQGRPKGPQAVAPRRALTELPLPTPASGRVNSEGEGGFRRGRTRTGLRLTFRGGLPETMTGQILAGFTGLLLLGALVLGGFAVRRLMQRDERFLIPGAGAIETAGNQHLSREELVSALADDVGRNVFSLALDRQRATLERLPWVERATVMRLLPDRLRVTVVERTPIAFAREKGKIGLVDAHGVLLDLRQVNGTGSYSFPVVTGIVAADPLETRAARMKLFQEFVGALDGTGEHISAKLSEIDLSNPEDVRALIPDSGSEVLVHFGDSDYLARYRTYEGHLAEWRQQYPHLASVDMRYERQAVLEMTPGAAVPVNDAPDAAKEIPMALAKFGGAAARGARVGGTQHAARAGVAGHAGQRSGAIGGSAPAHAGTRIVRRAGKVVAR